MATFDEIKQSFWGPDSYGVLPPLTSEAVIEAERLLDVTLPASLIDLLSIQNGGQVVPGLQACPTTEPTSWSEDHVPVDQLMGIGRKDNVLSLLDTPYLVQEWELPEPLALLTGDGHWWIALDYRKSGRRGEPSVVWLDVERSEELVLAADFRAFVERLTSP
ncbi:SMI1/KNR4 family protein [Amycolatopsis sp. cg5]|uniref:SMI1/KNR4 family protein n=1 Tax=Amycolatopsis sp. cg5 TaxID=3238802 RepID=UPI0035242E82